MVAHGGVTGKAGRQGTGEDSRRSAVQRQGIFRVAVEELNGAAFRQGQREIPIGLDLFF